MPLDDVVELQRVVERVSVGGLPTPLHCCLVLVGLLAVTRLSLIVGRGEEFPRGNLALNRRKATPRLEIELLELCNVTNQAWCCRNQVAGEAFLTTRVRRGQLLRLLFDLKGLGDARTRRRLNFLVTSFAEARASLGQMRVKVSDELLCAWRAL